MNNWEIITSETTGRQYYFNPETGESSWLPPKIPLELGRFILDFNRNEFKIKGIRPDNIPTKELFKLSFLNFDMLFINSEIGYNYDYLNNKNEHETNISLHSLTEGLLGNNIWIMCTENYVYYYLGDTGFIEIQTSIKTNTDMRPSLRRCIRELIELGVPNHVNLENED